MHKYLLIALVVLMCGSVEGLAQSSVLDGTYIKEHTPNRRVIPYTHLREADVAWLKRVWREVDLRQKTNHVFYFPTKPMQGRKNLFDVIIDAIVNEGTLHAYSTGDLGDDDMFTTELTLPEVQSQLGDTIIQWVEDPDTGEMIETATFNELESTQIKKCQIKEEWFFDNQRSVMDVRILGLAPVKEEYNLETGDFKGYAKLFWIYYPEARYVFSNAEVFNRANDAERRTMEDVIWKRMFDSYVIKESNVYDRNIAEYKKGLNALLEAEKIKENIFNVEHDLWHF